MKNIYFYFLLSLCLSCNSKQDAPQKQTVEPFKSTVTAQELLDLSVKASGLDKLYNATLTFEKKGVKYSAMRDQYAYEFRMTRIKNGIDYLAIASNGNFEYTENGEAVSYGSQNSLLEHKLIFDNNLMAIPRLFQNDNSITVTSVGQVEVKNIDYRVLQIHFKGQLPSDKMRNVRVYISPKSLLPDYICYSYGDNTRLLWMENTKRHNIDDVIISDFVTYISKKGTDNHDDMVSYVNTGALQQTERIEFKNLKLIENKSNEN